MISSTFGESQAAQILKELRNRIPTEQWSTWFEEVELTDNRETFTLHTPSSLHSSVLQHQYKTIIENVIKEMSEEGATLDLVFEVKLSSSK